MLRVLHCRNTAASILLPTDTGSRGIGRPGALVAGALVLAGVLARPAPAAALEGPGAVLATAELGLVLTARAATFLPPLPTRSPAGDRDTLELVTSKGTLSADGDDSADKLAISAKIKECCGYPISDRSGFRLSFYWLAYEAEYANETIDTDIYDRHGGWLGRYPGAFVYEVRLEGTGVLRDGRVINYDGACRYGIGTCFAVLDPTEHPLGRGVQARRLEPFRSVAVDPHYIPIGAPIYLPELVGMELPDGTRHDGCVRADDQGGAIKHGKIDFFVESYAHFKYFAEQQWWRLKTTPHLDEPRCEYLRLGEPRERSNERTDWLALHPSRGTSVMAMRGPLNARRRPSHVAAAERAHRQRASHLSPLPVRHRVGRR